MKNTYIIWLAAIFFLGLIACDEEVFDPVVGLDGAPQLANPLEGDEWLLEESKADEVLTTLSWSRADFGFSAPTTYTVEVDLESNGFSEAVTLLSTVLEEATLTHNKLNSILLAKGIDVASPVGVDFRVVAEVSDDIPTQTSRVVTVMVTPYIVEIVYPQLQVPGSHQGWDPANNSTVIFSLKSDRIFEGFIFFPDDATQFKYTDGPSWDVNYGDTGGDGTLESGSDNIIAGNAGVYRLNVDLNALTHSFTVANWGVLGDATPGGWDSDQDLTWDTETGILSATVDLNVGEIKFRANDAWDINFGDNDFDGKLEYGAANIPVSQAGTYLIELILNQAVYTYRLTRL